MFVIWSYPLYMYPDDLASQAFPNLAAVVVLADI